jgi:adenylate cyclase
MPVELQRRFLLDSLPGGSPASSTDITQVYWRLGDDWCLRLRRRGRPEDYQQELAIKGPRIGERRPEFEYPVFSGMSDDEKHESLELILRLHNVGIEHEISKVRHRCTIDGFSWNIDEFKGLNDGLIIAELELDADNKALGLTDAILRSLTKPAWASREITAEARYNNENLAYEPYSSWT